MRNRTANRVLALMLGLWVALAPAMLAAPAAGMNAQMNMSESNGSGDCNGCPDAGMAQDACASMCANALPFVTMPDIGRMVPVDFRPIDWPGGYSPLVGRILTPEPGPPRSITLR